VHGAERTWGAGGMFWVGVRILRGTPRRLDGRRGEIRRGEGRWVGEVEEEA
jgi:hypothetical protein